MKDNVYDNVDKRRNNFSVTKIIVKWIAIWLKCHFLCTFLLLKNSNTYFRLLSPRNGWKIFVDSLSRRLAEAQNVLHYEISFKVIEVGRESFHLAEMTIVKLKNLFFVEKQWNLFTIRSADKSEQRQGCQLFIALAVLQMTMKWSGNLYFWVQPFPKLMDSMNKINPYLKLSNALIFFFLSLS